MDATWIFPSGDDVWVSLVEPASLSVFRIIIQNRGEDVLLGVGGGSRWQGRKYPSQAEHPQRIMLKSVGLEMRHREQRCAFSPPLLSHCFALASFEVVGNLRDSDFSFSVMQSSAYESQTNRKRYPVAFSWLRTRAEGRRNPKQGRTCRRRCGRTWWEFGRSDWW